MPDQVPQPQGTQSQAQGAAQNTPQGQQSQQQSQEPAWFSHVPEQYREEAKKGWMMHSDYTNKTKSLSEQQKSWEAEKQKVLAENQKWTDWYTQQYQPFYQVYQRYKDKIDPILAGQAANQIQQAQPQNNGQMDPWENYDLLPPQEQAKRLAEYNRQQYLTDLNASRQEIFQTIAQYVKLFQDAVAIRDEAYAKKFTNPELDLMGFIQKANEFKYGRFNPIDAAYAVSTRDGDLKRMQEEWIRKGKEERDLELRNQQQSTGALQQPFVPVFKQQPISRAQIREQVRNEAAQKGIAWNNDFGG